MTNRGLAGAVAVSALVLLAPLAREARADLIAPEAVSAPAVVTPRQAGSAPAPAAQPGVSPAAAAEPPAPEPAPASEPGQWTPPALGRNPFDTDRPTDYNGNYPAQLPLPSDDACEMACLKTWSVYIYEERAAFLHAVYLNGGLKTRSDEVRDEELLDAIDEVEKRMRELDRSKTPEPPQAATSEPVEPEPTEPEPAEPPTAPDPFATADGPLSGSPDGPDAPAGDPAEPDSGPSADSSDSGGASGGGGGLSDEDDPFYLLD